MFGCTVGERDGFNLANLHIFHMALSRQCPSNTSCVRDACKKSDELGLNQRKTKFGMSVYFFFFYMPH